MSSKNAIDDIAAERARQISVEGWTPEHDSQHDQGALAAAAASYALQAASRSANGGWVESYRYYARKVWPFDAEWWKPKNSRRDLIRAGALIVAEIERLDRAAPPAAPTARDGGDDARFEAQFDASVDQAANRIQDEFTRLHDALVAASQRETALRDALRSSCMFWRYGPWAKKGYIVDGCNLCIQNWPTGTKEKHAPGCLAALQTTQQEET